MSTKQIILDPTKKGIEIVDGQIKIGPFVNADIISQIAAEMDLEIPEGVTRDDLKKINKDGSEGIGLDNPAVVFTAGVKMIRLPRVTEPTDVTEIIFAGFIKNEDGEIAIMTHGKKVSEATKTALNAGPTKVEGKIALWDLMEIENSDLIDPFSLYNEKYSVVVVRRGGFFKGGTTIYIRNPKSFSIPDPLAGYKVVGPPGARKVLGTASADDAKAIFTAVCNLLFY